MEYWEQLLVWLPVSSFAAAVFYYICFKVFGKDILRAPRQPVRITPVPVPVGQFRSNRGSQVSREEVEQLVYEEYRSETQGECAAAVAYDPREGKVVGICAFQNELKVEYFVESFNSLCLIKSCLERSDNLGVRALLGAISHWGPKWAGSEVVHVLTPDREVSLLANTEDTTVHKIISKLEEKYLFKASVQYSGNFICHDADHEELWDELISMSGRLLRWDEKEGDPSWVDFPVEHWERRRSNMEGQWDTHLLPAMEGENLADEVKIVDNLVSLEG